MRRGRDVPEEVEVVKCDSTMKLVTRISPLGAQSGLRYTSARPVTPSHEPPSRTPSFLRRRHVVPSCSLPAPARRLGAQAEERSETRLQDYVPIRNPQQRIAA